MHRAGKMRQYGVPDFDNLKTSTRTVMVYSNVIFNLPMIFKSLYITPVDVPLTKKKKNVDKKRLQAPYGAIISVQKGIQFRGIDLRKRKKHWCSPNCRVVEQRGSKEVEILTVVEEPHLIEGTDIYEIKYFCTQCEYYYTLGQLKKITNFLNQVTVVLSIGKIILNIMMFKDNFKIAGCRENNDAVEATLILWQDYVEQMSKGWRLKPDSLTAQEHPMFIFRLVMRNVDFKLGFFIDREELNKLMNNDRYSDRVFMSQCETTGHTNVNIKMFAVKPNNYMYDCLVLPKEKEAYFIKIRHNLYKPKKSKKPKFTTFIVFSSSEIILSGRYEENMRDVYEFFVTEVVGHRNTIEEKINEPSLDLITHLKKTKKPKTPAV